MTNLTNRERTLGDILKQHLPEKYRYLPVSWAFLFYREDLISELLAKARKKLERETKTHNQKFILTKD